MQESQAVEFVLRLYTMGQIIPSNNLVDRFSNQCNLKQTINIKVYSNIQCLLNVNLNCNLFYQNIITHTLGYYTY